MKTLTSIFKRQTNNIADPKLSTILVETPEGSHTVEIDPQATTVADVARRVGMNPDLPVLVTDTIGGHLPGDPSTVIGRYATGIIFCFKIAE